MVAPSTETKKFPDRDKQTAVPHTHENTLTERGDEMMGRPKDNRYFMLRVTSWSRARCLAS